MNALFLTPTTQIVNLLVPSLLALVPDDIMQQGLDALLDVVEDAIAKSSTPMDDAVVLPIIVALRAKFKIADND
jgi:hypothetical protein